MQKIRKCFELFQRPRYNFSHELLKGRQNQKDRGVSTFVVRIRTKIQDQISFFPFTLHEISVLAELALRHLRCLLTNVPPQSNTFVYLISKII